MDNFLIKHKTEGYIARITHWEHFYVNRATGYIIDHAFTYKVMTGEDTDKTFVQATSHLEIDFDIVGNMKSDQRIH